VQFDQAYASALTEQIQAISLFIYDSELMKEHATDADPWATDWAAQNPTDGGYYVVSDTTANQEIVLTANPDYLGDNPSNIETIRFTVVSDSAAASVLLEEGDVDVALGLSTSEIADLDGADGVDVISAPSNQMVYLPINTTSETLSDPLVRQAIAQAIPYDEIIDTVYGGEARRPKSIVPIDMPGYTEDGFPYDEDLDAASALMEEAGVSDLTIELGYAAESGEQEQIAILVQDALSQIGITVELSPLDSATLGERRAAKDLDMQIASGQQWVNDVEYLMAGWTTGGFTNYANYSSATVDGLVDEASATTDADERNELWAELQTEFANDVPVIPLAQPNFSLPVRDNVGGFVQPVDGLIRFNTFTLD
jgi:peptide/nickel transport system substrate-binding protein